MARVREFSLEDLGIPNLAVKRHKLANGTVSNVRAPFES